MNSNLQQAIQRQRSILKGWLATSLTTLANACREDWPARDKLEARLQEGMIELPYCKYLYALDHQALQITANISRIGKLAEHCGRDRSARPYLTEALAGSRFSLSESYISRNAKRPSLTAIQQIENHDGKLLGYLGADFDLRELPATQALYARPDQWMQMRGDPAIRAGLFHQERVNSPMDDHIDEIMALLVELMTVHGVYHGKLHFSSSRATLWMLDDPYSYRIHGFNDLSDPNLCLAYPRHAYPEKAIVPVDAIPKIFRCFRDLRFMDETLYLRAGSLNLFNGMVGLTFSCDGSHYMPWDEFLEKNLGFWLGTSAPTCG